jgi:hypothetical protein
VVDLLLQTRKDSVLAEYQSTQPFAFLLESASSGGMW